MKKNHDIVTVDVVVMHQTEKAYLLETAETDDKGKSVGVWVPKSQVEYDETDKNDANAGVVSSR